MSTSTTTKTVDLAQLTAELDGAPLSAATNDGQSVITCHDPAITQAQLQSAVDAHTPAPQPPSPEALLQQQIDDLLDLLIDMEVI
jgi:hypothetical protein